MTGFPVRAQRFLTDVITACRGVSAAYVGGIDALLRETGEDFADSHIGHGIRQVEHYLRHVAETRRRPDSA